MNIRLQVPHIYQAENSMDCSIAAVTMVLQYKKNLITFEEVKKLTLLHYKERVYTEGLALELQRKNHKISYQHYNINALDKDTARKTEQDIDIFRDKIQILFNEGKSDSPMYKKIQYAINLIESGAMYSTHIPTLDTINNALEQGIPPIICVSQRVLKIDQYNTANHYIVISGIDGDNYYINDPYPTFKSTYLLDKNTLLYAWYAAGANTILIYN